VPTAWSADAVTPIWCVNTCAFVEEAREESVATILALDDARLDGSQLVVTGCMAERYGDELAQSLPEVGAVVGPGGGSLAERVRMVAVPVDMPVLRRGGPAGLGSRCATCSSCPPGAEARPGPMRSPGDSGRVLPDPTFGARARERRIHRGDARPRDRGVAEIVLVAQDPAWYGRDAGEPGALAPLLLRLDPLAAEGLARVRLLYLYPSEVRDPLVATMLELPTVVPYFDLSLQHADGALLRRMKRWGSGDRFLASIDAIRAQEPAAAFRSSFIVGFPGEEARHDRLLAFLEKYPARLGGLFLSPEEAPQPRRCPARVAECGGCGSAPRCRSRSPAPRATRSSARRSRCSSTPSPPTASSGVRTGRRPRSTASCTSTPTPEPTCGRAPVLWCGPT
jgi:ribosomal protein S12 methylthiotransferase